MKKIIIGAAVAALALGVAYYTGYHSGVADVNAEVAQEKATWEATIKNLEESHRAEVVRVREELAVENTKLQAQLDALKDESILDHYVTIEENSKLPVGFVEYHDRLVLNVPVNTIPHGGSSTITLRDLMTVLAKNYTMCHADQVKLANLQAIVRDFIAKQESVK